MLNKKQALELFAREAVYLGTNDSVPLFRVRQLFGDTVVKPIEQELNIDHDCGFIHLAQFLDIVSMANYQECIALANNDPVALFLYQFSHDPKNKKETINE